ncbi:MAG: GH3 auxin-responsive promoter family protein [Planctomycetota bacterium]|nr:GH3 auxin-responsive promoter family protein [Planctomycetota bacterium]
MGFIASVVIKTVGRSAAKRFEAATRDAVDTQLRKLMDIVQRNQDTEYGREFGFRSIRSLEDWQNAVPVITYEDIKDRVDRVTRGESNVLTAEDPVMFARTSGTTGDAKYVPLTRTCQGRDHSDQMRTWFHHAAVAHPRIFSGKVLSLVSPAIEGYAPSGVPYGSTSGHIYKNMPGLVRSTYLVPYEVFELEDYEAKYYIIMRLGIGADVSFLATANPSSIIKMCEIANDNADVLLKDLHDGTLNPKLSIPPELRALLQPRMRRDPERAKRLERARERRAGMLLPADYWPGLDLIGCWKGGTVGAYVDRFPGWFDPDGRKGVPVRDWGYLSSEARGSIPLSDDGSGGVLTVATNVYEFVAVDDLEANPDDRETWNFLSVNQIKEGQEYYIFFTTTGGLYRYDINDVIEVIGWYNSAPVVVFRRKGRGMTSITGEKVSVNQVIDAVERASKEFAIAVDHFKAEADVDTARYVFKVESATGLPPDKRRSFLGAIDRHLSDLNLEYEAKRKSLRLNSPLLHSMKTGWYDAEKKKLVASGKRLFQAKTVLLSTKKDLDKDDWLEDITSLD